MEEDAVAVRTKEAYDKRYNALVSGEAFESGLIAQLGKNYAGGRNKKITGQELVELAWTVIEDALYMLGGMVAFLEAENEEKLLSFYRDNRFSQFDTRQTVLGKDEPHELVQLLRLL